MSGRSIAIQCNVVQSCVRQCDRVEIGIVRVQSSESLVVVHVCNPPSRQLRASDTDLGLVRHRHEGIKLLQSCLWKRVHMNSVCKRYNSFLFWPKHSICRVLQSLSPKTNNGEAPLTAKCSIGY